MPKAMTKAIIEKNIETIRVSGPEIAKLIHETAMAGIRHASIHGDAVYVDRLFKAMHKALRPEAFKRWVSNFSPIAWSGDGKVGLRGEDLKNYRPFNIEGAEKEPYYDWEKETKAPALLDAVTFKNNVLAFIKRNTADDKVAPEDKQAIAVIANRLTAAVG